MQVNQIQIKDICTTFVQNTENSRIYASNSQKNLERKRIETIFSQFADQFMINRKYAKNTINLFTKNTINLFTLIIAKISTFTILQYANYFSNKSIGKVKYSLD